MADATWPPTCARCDEPIDEPGALMFGVPDAAARVSKLHVCARCWSVRPPWMGGTGPSSESLAAAHAAGRDEAMKDALAICNDTIRENLARSDLGYGWNNAVREVQTRLLDMLENDDDDESEDSDGVKEGEDASGE